MSKKIKVLHIADKFGVAGSSIHGVTRLFSWWIPRYDKGRFDVKLVGLRKPDAACKNLEKMGIPVISLCKTKFDFSTIKAIEDLIEKEKADLVHLHGYGSTNFGILAAKKKKIRIIAHEHFVDPSLPFYQRPFDFFLSKKIDYGIAVSHSVKEFMVKDRYFKKSKVEVIYNGAPLDEFNPVSRKKIEKEKEKWHLSDDIKVITTIGRIGEQKGHKYLIDALSIVVKKYDKVRLLIVGDGPLMETLKKQAKSLNIEKYLLFTGHHKDIPTIQSITDIQVFSSLWEGTPLTLFEAMAMRMPIVSTDVDGLGEVLEDEHNALVVKPRDSKSLADRLLKVLEDDVLAQQLANKALEDSRKYDIQACVNKMQDCYLLVLNNKRYNFD